MPSRSATPLIVIGLDSADWQLVTRWCDSGDLPTLRAIRDGGMSGRLETPPGLGDDAVWASMYTALSPGRHGRYHHRQFRPGRYWNMPVMPLECTPFWDTLGRAGRRVAVLDVPKSPLSTDLNGIQLVNWLVHGPNGRTASAPATLAPDLVQRLGDDLTDHWPGAMCIEEMLPEAEQAVLVERALASIQWKTAAAVELLAREAWDLFLVVFKEAHCAGHQLWHHTDSTHPAHRADVVARLGDPVKRVYQALDAAIARVLAAGPPDARVVVFSNLGMGGNFTGEHLLDAIILRLDGFRPAGLWRYAYHRTERAPSSTIGRAARRVQRELYRYRSAFQVFHNEISGAIRVNVKGREPNGRIAPGAELAAYVDTLAADLLALVDPGTGAPIVSRVVRSDEAFPGERRHLLPDLFAVWSRRPATAIASPKLGEMRFPFRPWRTGNHTPDGFFVARGPAVRAGQLPVAASIMDLGPSLCHMLGVPLPAVDGRPITALCA